MTLRVIFGVLLGLVALAAALRFSDSTLLGDWLRTPAPAKPIVFDNGSIRDGAATTTQTIPVPGGLRKCRRGEQTSYTDGVCPPGWREQPLKGGTVTVVPGQAAAKPAAPAVAGTEARTKTIRDVLDVNGNAEFKAKQIDRVTGQ